MKLYPRVALLLLLALLLSASGIAWGSVPFQDDIGAVLNQPDGSRISLQCEEIMSIGRSGKSFGIKEFCERQPTYPRLVVVSTHPLPVSRYWSCDIQGQLSTFSGVTRNGGAFRQRVLIVSAQDVLIYCDQRGRPFLFPPLKGLGIEWPNKCSLADLESTSTIQAASISTMDEGSLPSLPDDPLTEETTPDNRTGLKYLPDGAYLHLRDRVVSAAFGDSFYIEEPDRSSAIRVNGMYAYYPSPGNLIEISGVLTTEGGERTILVDSSNPAHFVTTLDSGYTIPRPLGMVNRAIGGGMAGQYTQGIGSSVGLNNTGLLVTVWGKVTSDVYYDSYGSYYFIDDGSGLQDSQGHTGIKVRDNSRWPAIGDYLTLTGIAACEIPAGKTTSIPCLFATDYTPATSGTGTGTMSGSVTADASAANQVVRIYGTGGSTTCTLNSSGSGTYTMSSIRAGVHTFSADLPCYTRDTAKVTITANQNSTQDFVLSGAQAAIMASSTPSAITACTGEPSTITAVVYFDSGIGCGNSTVTFQTDLGQFAADTHTQEIQVTTNAQGKAAVQLWQGSDSPGVAHITVSSTSPTASGSVDVPIVCPTPNGVFATGVGSGKIAIYWDTCSGATGYEVYRGTVAGGDKSILAGTAQPSFVGSDKMIFIDQTAVDDTTYYYSVKAVYGCGVSEASYEDDATTNSYAIPWDTRDTNAILQAANQRVTVSANKFIVIGPDGTSYISGSSPLQPWPFDLGPTPELGDQESGSTMTLAAASSYDPVKDPDNPHNGPYRKVESRPGYRKITGIAILPSGNNVNVSPAGFDPGSTRKRRGVDVECPNSGDIPFIYFGGTGDTTINPETGKMTGKYPLDFGLRYEPTDGHWNVFFLRPPSKSDKPDKDGKKYSVFWVYDHDRSPLYDQFIDTMPDLPLPPQADWIDFAPGQSMLMECWCTKSKNGTKTLKSGVSFRATGIDAITQTTKALQVFTEITGYPESGDKVSLKWVTSIGQYFPDNGDKKQMGVGFIGSGSYMRGAGFDSVQVYDQTRAWYLDVDRYRNSMKFPKEPGVVATKGTRYPYYRELDIWVDLTVNQ